MKDIILFGGGGHCYASIALIKSLGEYLPSVIYDDNPKVEEVMGVRLKEYHNEAIERKLMCISIGDNRVRKEKANKFAKAIFPSFIHSSSVIYPSSIIGEGSLILPNAVLDAECNIGSFCIINNNATVSHNVVLQDFVHVAINVAIAGGVRVGEGSLLGAGSIILPDIKVGKWVVIGAGAVVTKDIPDHAVAYGNPAKIIKSNSSE
jgi:acetyltransferase EpsM